MRGIFKRLISILIGLVLTLTTALTNWIPVTASETNGPLEDGIYSVPITISSSRSVQNVLNTRDKYRYALVEVEDGEYTVTLRISNIMQNGNQYTKELKVLKNEYTADDIADPWNEGLVAWGTDASLFEDDQYWRDDVEQKYFNETLNYADFEFMLEDPEQTIVIANNYGTYVEYYNIIELVYTQAVELPEEIEEKEYTWSFTLSNAYTNSLHVSGTNTAESGNVINTSTEIYEIIEEDADVSVEGTTATATFTLTEKGRDLIGDDKVAVMKKNSNNEGYSNLASYFASYYLKDYETISINEEDGTFTIEFDLTDYRDMVFGQVVKILYENEDDEYNTYLFGALHLTEDAIQSVTLEEKEENSVLGAEFLTTTASVSKDDYLVVEELTEEDEGYERFDEALSGTTRGWKAYNIKVMSATGEEKSITSEGTLRIPLPDEGEEGTSYIGYLFNGTSGNLFKVTDTSMGYLEIDTSLDRPYAVVASDLKSDATAEDLDNGVYEVSWYIEMESGAGTSMADSAFEKPAKLIVEDGTVRLELTQQGVELGGVSGYLSRAYLIIDDETGEKEPLVATSYLKNDDGTYYDLSFYAGRTYYYPLAPSTMYLELDASHDGYYEIEFRIPVMDGLNTVGDGYVGRADKTAYLIIDYETAVPIDDEEPEDAPIDEALTAAKETLEYLSEYWPEISPEAWAQIDVDALLEAAETASAGTADEMKAAWRQLQEAIDNLTDSYLTSTAYNDTGIYTADASLADNADGQAAITEARFRVDDDNQIYVTLKTTGIDEFQYYNIGTRSFVDADTLKDSGGNITGFTFVLPERFSEEWMYTEMGVSYLVSGTGDNAEYTETWLSLTDVSLEGEAADMTELESLMATANARIEEQTTTPGTYDDDAIDILTEALAEAQVVYNDPTAFQSEVDAQVAALTEALSALKGDTTELEALLETAKAAAADETYTSGSREELQALIDEAETLIAGEPSQAEVDAMYDEINAFLESGLVEVVDKTELEELIATAEAIENENYSGYDQLLAAIESAKAVLEDDNATAEDVRDMVDALEAAITNLGADSVDKEELRDLVEEVEGLLASGSYDGCTQETLDLLNASVEAAKAVLEDATATQADVDRHYQMIENADAAMLQEQTGLADGIYEVSVNTWQAADPDAASMSDAAIAGSWVIVENGEPAYLRLQFQPLTTSLGAAMLTGYLESIGYYANYHSTDIPTTSSGLTPTAATVEERFTDEEIAATYVDYGGEDPFVSYKDTNENYPKTVLLPIESDGAGGYYTEYWIRVHVPVMASISVSSGTQNARLVINVDNWNDMVQVEGTSDADTTALQEAVDAASALLSEVSDGSYRSEDVTVLSAAVTAGNAFLNNLNIDQDMVDAMVTAVTTAQNLFTVDTVESSKETLGDLIAQAEEAIARTDVTYSEGSLQTLTWTLESAKIVYDNPEATQSQVDFWANRLSAALDGLTVISADKTGLAAALDAALERLSDTGTYSEASLAVLQSLYDNALAVYNDPESSQSEVDRQAALLNTYLDNMSEMTDATGSAVVKDGLYAMLMTASNMAGREGSFTAETISALKAAIEEADAVYNNPDATQSEVNAQASKLYYAMLALEGRTTDTSGTGTGSGSGTGTGTDSGSDSSLDIENLEDGVYIVTGEMVKAAGAKTSDEEYSMANEGINHTIVLTVENGEYTLTVDFKGMTIGSDFGYLGTLKYFLTGYTTNTYGVPQGDLADATVLSYQTNEDGSLVSDSFGTDYPDYVSFPLISEALEDGYVPLQVFVPVMESISSGLGTQAVYLKLDWSTLAVTGTSNLDDIYADGDPAVSTGTDDGGDDTTTLTTSSLGSSSLGTSSLGSSSLGSSGLSSASSVKTGDTSGSTAGFAALLAVGVMALLAGVSQRRGKKTDTR